MSYDPVKLSGVATIVVLVTLQFVIVPYACPAIPPTYLLPLIVALLTFTFSTNPVLKILPATAAIPVSLNASIVTFSKFKFLTVPFKNPNNPTGDADFSSLTYVKLEIVYP